MGLGDKVEDKYHGHDLVENKFEKEPLMGGTLKPHQMASFPQARSSVSRINSRFKSTRKSSRTSTCSSRICAPITARIIGEIISPPDELPRPPLPLVFTPLPLVEPLRPYPLTSSCFAPLPIGRAAYLLSAISSPSIATSMALVPLILLIAAPLMMTTLICVCSNKGLVLRYYMFRFLSVFHSLLLKKEFSTQIIKCHLCREMSYCSNKAFILICQPKNSMLNEILLRK